MGEFDAVEERVEDLDGIGIDAVLLDVETDVVGKAARTGIEVLARCPGCGWTTEAGGRMIHRSRRSWRLRMPKGPTRTARRFLYGMVGHRTSSGSIGCASRTHRPAMNVRPVLLLLQALTSLFLPSRPDMPRQERAGADRAVGVRRQRMEAVQCAAQRPT